MYEVNVKNEAITRRIRVVTCLSVSVYDMAFISSMFLYLFCLRYVNLWRNAIQ